MAVVKMDVEKTIETALGKYHTKHFAPYVRAQSLITAYFMDYFRPVEQRIKDPIFSLEDSIARHSIHSVLEFIGLMRERNANSFTADDYIEYCKSQLNGSAELCQYDGVYPELMKIVPYMCLVNALCFTTSIFADTNVAGIYESLVSKDFSSEYLSNVKDFIKNNGEVIFSLNNDLEGLNIGHHTLIAGYTTKNHKAVILFSPHVFEDVGKIELNVSMEETAYKEIRNLSAKSMAMALAKTKTAINEDNHPQLEGRGLMCFSYSLPLSSDIEEYRAEDDWMNEESPELSDEDIAMVFDKIKELRK